MKDESAKEALDEVRSMNLRALHRLKCLIAEDGEADADAVTGTGVKNPGLEISVTEAPGTKCPRCWMHSENPQDGTGLCPRCAAVVAKL